MAFSEANIIFPIIIGHYKEISYSKDPNSSFFLILLPVYSMEISLYLKSLPPLSSSLNYLQLLFVFV